VHFSIHYSILSATVTQWNSQPGASMLPDCVILCWKVSKTQVN
jgi:hypothetical protein